MTPANPFFNELKYSEYLRRLVMSRRRTVYALEFNADATHLASGNSAGHLNIFDLQAAAGEFSSTSNEFVHSREKGVGVDISRSPSPSLSIHTDAGPMYSLFSDCNLLFCGADSAIMVYRWEHLLDDSEKCAPVYKTSVHAKASHGVVDEPIETNAITGMRMGSHVYAATGNGTVECFSSDKLRFEERFQGAGPRAYFHCIAMCGTQEQNTFITGADDGVVRLYDRRCGLFPQRDFDLQRLVPSATRAWVGCIATDVDGGFMICGNGNRKLTSIHLGSGSVLGSTDLDFVPNALVYRGAEVYCGGADRLPGSRQGTGDSEHMLYRYSLECTEVGTSPVSASGVYAVASHMSSKCMAAAGYSTRHRWHDAAELIDMYVHPPARSFYMAASELAISPE